MSRNRKDAKEILNRSIDFIRDISVKVQQEASRTWKLSNIKMEMLKLKRKKNENLKKLGEKTFTLMSKSKLSARSLNRVYKELTKIEEQLREKEEETKQVDVEWPSEKLSDRQKRMEISKAKRAKGHSKVSSKTVLSKKQADQETKKTKTKERAPTKKV